MKNLIQDTLNRIRSEHIAPEPRWKFLLRKFGIWAFVISIIVLVALATSVVYYLLSQLDWDLYGFMHQNAFFYVLSMLPYFWLILSGTLVVAAFLGMRETEGGYRLSGFKIVSVIIAGVFVIGFLLTSAGLGNRLNGMMMRGVPFYAQNIETREKQWMRPEQGFLAGTISGVHGNELELVDLNGEKWIIGINEKTFMRPMVDVSVGQMIKIIGMKKSKVIFIASEIRPWVGHGMMRGRQQDESVTCDLEEINKCGNHGRNMQRNR